MGRVEREIVQDFLKQWRVICKRQESCHNCKLRYSCTSYGRHPDDVDEAALAGEVEAEYTRLKNRLGGDAA